MKGTKCVNHGGMGDMPKRMGSEMHGSMGKMGGASGKTDMKGKFNTPSMGKQHAGTSGGKQGAVKTPKTRPASFGK